MAHNAIYPLKLQFGELDAGKVLKVQRLKPHLFRLGDS